MNELTRDLKVRSMTMTNEGKHSDAGLMMRAAERIKELEDRAASTESRLKKMTEVARESQGWDWLQADIQSEELGIDHYEIDDMQRLCDAVTREELS